ncbi:unnamed protein product, partial [marine sediment metagenome]
MIYEAEILKRGYKKAAENLYIKDDKLFVQHRGSILEASELTMDELNTVTSIVAYQKELKKLGGASGSKEEKPSDEKKMVGPKADKKTMEIVLRGSEDDITRVIKAHRMDLIIEASEDKKHPGKGILYYDEPKIGVEPSVQLIDMITADMGNIETDVTMLENKHHVNEITGFCVDTYCAVVRARDTLTGASGLGTAEEVIDWRDWTREKNPKSFALT